MDVPQRKAVPYGIPNVCGMERFAAVLIPIVDAAPYEVIFIERPLHMRRHAGEIAFPGGAVDEGDEGDHERAALREVEEEIGLPRAGVRVIGRLPAVVQRSKTFTVTPFVGIVDAAVPLVPDAGEVAALHRVPLAEVVAPGAVRRGIETIGERRIETMQFDRPGLHVWGLTGHILASFVERYRATESPLRAALDALRR